MKRLISFLFPVAAIAAASMPAHGQEIVKPWLMPWIVVQNGYAVAGGFEGHATEKECKDSGEAAKKLAEGKGVSILYWCNKVDVPPEKFTPPQKRGAES